MAALRRKNDRQRGMPGWYGGGLNRPGHSQHRRGETCGACMEGSLSLDFWRCSLGEATDLEDAPKLKPDSFQRLSRSSLAGSW
jgi:hypothetical protein